MWEASLATKASNIRWTHYEIHVKRGFDAMDGILSDFKGTMVHDPRTPYFGYKLSHHALCNALTSTIIAINKKMSQEQAWAADMAE